MTSNYFYDHSSTVACFYNHAAALLWNVVLRHKTCMLICVLLFTSFQSLPSSQSLILHLSERKPGLMVSWSCDAFYRTHVKIVPALLVFLGVLKFVEPHYVSLKQLFCLCKKKKKKRKKNQTQNKEVVSQALIGVGTKSRENFLNFS